MTTDATHSETYEKGLQVRREVLAAYTAELLRRVAGAPADV